MRIIGGKYRGYVLRPPPGLPVRPTTDRAKESLFNILEVRYGIEGATVLELFAGTGNISYEFASRGAERLLSIDQSEKAVAFINDTFKKLDINGKAIKANVFTFVKQCADTFDFIFADPPYDLNRMNELPSLLLSSGLLKESGLFILEHARQTSVPSDGLIDQRIYGQSVFSFYGKKSNFEGS